MTSSDRKKRRDRVVNAAKRMVHFGEHCTQGYRGPCEHCSAWDALEAAVEALQPIDLFIVDAPKEET